MLWGEDEEGHAEGGIRARSENPYLLLHPLYPEAYLRPHAPANPVTLHGLYSLRPLDAAVVQKLLGIFRNLEEPLLQVSFTNYCPASLTRAIGQNLLISQHCLAVGAPVDGGLGTVGQPRLIELQEEPLRPLIVFWQTGDDLPLPVIDSTHAPELTAHILYILHGPVIGVDAPADSRILCGKPEGIKAHGVEDVITLHPLEAGMGIGGGHSKPVPDV